MNLPLREIAMCRRKAVFATKAAATAAMKTMLRRGEVNLHAFRCVVNPDHFHIGHRRPTKGRRKR